MKPAEKECSGAAIAGLFWLVLANVFQIAQRQGLILSSATKVDQLERRVESLEAARHKGR